MSDIPKNDQNEKSYLNPVCIDTKQIYDDCVSRDCLEDLRVTFFSKGQRLIDDAITVKCKECTISCVSIDVEEVPFNRGYYSVDITFYFRLCFDTYSSPCTTPETAVGFTQFSKKCILYGADGDVKIFTSDIVSEELDCPEAPKHSNPTAKVQAVDPVVLSTDVVDVCDCPYPLYSSFPKSIINNTGDCVPSTSQSKAVLVTLGLFSIIQMERDVQLLIPSYDYCIPENRCMCNTKDPCETFNTISFPMDEFFPNSNHDEDNDECNSCSKKLDKIDLEKTETE